MSIEIFAAIAVMLAGLLLASSGYFSCPLRLLGFFISIAACVGTYLLRAVELRSMGPMDALNASPYREGIVLLLILLGIAAHHYWRENTRDGLDKPRKAWVYAFALAAMLFGSVLTQIGDQPISWFVSLFAFQNGFFWRALMTTRD